MLDFISDVGSTEIFQETVTGIRVGVFGTSNGSDEFFGAVEVGHRLGALGLFFPCLFSRINIDGRRNQAENVVLVAVVVFPRKPQHEAELVSLC